MSAREDGDDKLDKREECIQKRRAVDQAWTLRAGDRARSGAHARRLFDADGFDAAVATLRKMMVDQAAPASTRVRAAECIINHAAKAVEIEDIEVRVSELERAAEARKRK